MRNTGFGHCSRHALTAAQVSVTAADMHSPQHRFRSLQPTCTHRSTGTGHCSRRALTAAQVSVTAADMHSRSPQHRFRSLQPTCTHRSTGIGRAQPCETCWCCRCESTKKLCKWMVEEAVQKADLKEQVETMICQLGTQNLLMSSHWDSSTKDVMIKFNQLKVKLSNVELELKDKSKQLISTINELKVGP